MRTFLARIRGPMVVLGEPLAPEWTWTETVRAKDLDQAMDELLARRREGERVVKVAEVG